MIENVTKESTKLLVDESRSRDLTVSETASIIAYAQQFAIEQHGDALHGERPYVEHLQQVANKVESIVSQSHWPVVAAAWLHDVVEDTETTVADIEKIFGATTAGLVDLVTDRPGKNRRERHLNTYWRIRMDHHAVLIKLCDRISNQGFCLIDKNSFIDMYRKEYVNFKFALYNGPQWAELWAELDAQYEEMTFHHVYGDR